MIILIIIGCIIALFILVALVTNRQMNIERSVVINKPADEVFEYIRHVKNHDTFNVWTMLDPDMKKTYTGTDGQVGFIYAWDSANNKNVGAGEQEIKKITPGHEIEFELRFIRPMQNVASAKMTTAPAGPGQTKMQWGFYGKMKFPMNAMKPIMEKMLGRDLQKGVDNLKAVMEK